MVPPEDLEALDLLFLDLFTECENLRRFVATTPGAAKLVPELPGTGASISSLGHKVARGLESHGLVNLALFERLCAERPHRHPDISRVAQRFGVTLGPTSASPLMGESTPLSSIAISTAPELSQSVRSELLQRFIAEPGGRRRLVSALQEQAVVAHDLAIAARLADAAQLQHFPSETSLVQQDGTDTDILLILAGSVAIRVNGDVVAVRRAGQHVGEMAMIDPAQRRSATISAHDETVVARITEDEFVRVATDFPILWRRLAVELGARLRERGRLVRPRHAHPHVFIGSTDAGLSLARAFEAELRAEPWDIRVWPDGAHGIGKSSSESLIAQLSQLDFGLLIVASADLDVSASGGGTRDGLVFQVGLLVGTLGRDRTLIAIVRGAGDGGLLPGYLGGVRCLDVIMEPDLASPRIASAAAEIRLLVNHHFHR